VTFLDNRPLQIDVPAGETEATATVEVLAGGDDTEDITLDVGSLVGEPADKIPEIAIASCDAPEASAPRPTDSGAGEVQCFEITATGSEDLVGTYTGLLVAYGADGSFDRRELTINFAAAAVQGSAAPGALRTPLPAKVTWDAASWVPSPFRTLVRWGLDVDIPISPQLEARTTTGTVAGPNAVSGVADGDNDSDEVRITSVPGAGEFTGKLTFGAGIETELTLRVADALPWFLAIVLFGLWVAHILDRRLNRQEPLLRLRIALQLIRDEAVRKQEEAADGLPAMGDSWAGAARVWKVWAGAADAHVENGSGILAERAGDALRLFASDPDPVKAKETWSPTGEKVEKIRELIGVQVAFQERADALASLYTDVVEHLEPDELIALESEDIGRATRAAIEGRLIETSTDQVVVAVEQTEADELLNALSNAIEVIEDQAERLKKNPTKLDDLKAIRAQLFGPAVGKDRIAEIIKAARELTAEAPPSRAPIESPLLRELGGVTGARTKITSALARLEDALKRSEIGTALLAGGIVLLAALAALYLGKPAWGSWGDYVTAFLWGSVGGEAVKIALRLIPVGSSLGRFG
jgi:hypothetical protein